MQSFSSPHVADQEGIQELHSRNPSLTSGRDGPARFILRGWIQTKVYE
ncbi:hypothetical protein AVEN_139567-1, partial [Araneus ventricosus]